MGAKFANANGTNCHSLWAENPGREADRLRTPRYMIALAHIPGQYARQRVRTWWVGTPLPRVPDIR